MIRTFILTTLALIAFAANSVLNRLALSEGSIDAPSFTIIRLLSGAIVLFIILLIKNQQKPSSASKGSWASSLMLFTYAITFSLAYITLDTATGALILFTAVQLSMLLISLFKGSRLSLIEWFGMLIAFFGFVYLVYPDLGTPSVKGFILMSAAGTAWGVYTLNGRGTTDALADTAYNFIRTIPFVLVLLLITFSKSNYSTQGIVLAVISGAITSGIGYTIWYEALKGLSSTQAAVVQLSVPVLAALGGVVFVSEEITQRLIISIVFILGGILLVVFGKKNIQRS